MDRLEIKMPSYRMYEVIHSLVGSSTNHPTTLVLIDDEQDYSIELIWRESVPDSDGNTRIVLYQITTYVRGNDRLTLIHKNGITDDLVRSGAKQIIEMY